MYSNSGRPNHRLFQIECCKEVIKSLDKVDIFQKVLTYKCPIQNCSNARFAAMCVLLKRIENE